MKHTWRWFGPAAPITSAEVRQTGATGIVTALHHIANGSVWPVDQIRAREAEIEAAGLSWKVVESVPVHEDARRAGRRPRPPCRRTSRSCGNWPRAGSTSSTTTSCPSSTGTRTDLSYEMPDGALALRFDPVALAAFDLARPAAGGDWTAAQAEAASRLWEGLSGDRGVAAAFDDLGRAARG